VLTAEMPPSIRQIRLEAEPDAVAYVDREWLRATAGRETPALLVAGGSIRYEGQSRPLPPRVEPDLAAFRVIAQLAEAAIEALRPIEGEVEVIGSGLVAACVRRALPDGSAPSSVGRPRAIVDTTGDGETIEEAMQRLDDSGVIVLAGEAAEPSLKLNLYPDAHGRGLRLIGVGPRVSRLDDAFEEAHAGLPFEPVEVAPGGTLAPPALWYRVTFC
jgi:hypothetical protein